MEEIMTTMLAKFINSLLKIKSCLKTIIISLTQTIGSITIIIFFLVVITYFFTSFLHMVTAIASYFLVDLSSMSQNDIITKTVKEYFKFTKDDVPGFSKAVSQTAIGALIGTSFTLFANFLIKSISEKRNRLTSLRTALTVVELSIQSLFLLKDQFVAPKFLATKDNDFEKELPTITGMKKHDFLNFLNSKKVIFTKIINPKYSIDLDPEKFFYFLSTEDKNERERLYIMLCHYSRAKEIIGYLNELIKLQKELLMSAYDFEIKYVVDSETISKDRIIEYCGRFLSQIKETNDRMYIMLDKLLVFLLELRMEIKDFPKLPKNNNYILKQESHILLPNESIYEEVLDKWYYNRHKFRKVIL